MPGNSVSFNLYEGEDWQEKNINNIFGNRLLSLSLCKGKPVGENKVTSIRIYISKGDNFSCLFVIISENYSIDQSRWGSKDFLSWAKKEYPDATVDIARNGYSYNISRYGYNFILTTTEVVVKNSRIENISVIISVQ